MKTCLTLVVSLSFLGCAKQAPKYPDQLKQFHLIDVASQKFSPEFLERIVNANEIPISKANEVVRCLLFDVTEVNPFQFKYMGQVALTECHQVSGYKPEENVILWNWIDDIFKFLGQHNCFNKKQ